MIKITREFITPEIAEAMLACNTRNIRNISVNKLKDYVNDMKNGRWEDNGETIKFYADGTLFDGQHRLAAIVKSGISIWMHVARGVDDEVSITDVGSVRTVSQIAKVGNREAALAAALLKPNGKTSNGDTTKSDQVAFAKEHAEVLRTIVSIGIKSFQSSKAGKRFFAPTANSSAYLAILIAIRKKVATKEALSLFCKCANEGLPLDTESSAPLMLRKMFIEGVINEEGIRRNWNVGKNTDFVTYCCLTYRAIQAFATGKKITKRFTVGGLDFEELRKDALANIDQVEQDLGITGQTVIPDVVNA